MMYAQHSCSWWVVKTSAVRSVEERHVVWLLCWLLCVGQSGCWCLQTPSAVWSVAVAVTSTQSVTYRRLRWRSTGREMPPLNASSQSSELIIYRSPFLYYPASLSYAFLQCEAYNFIPGGFLKFFYQRLRTIKQNFTRLLYVDTYVKLHNFIHHKVMPY